MLLLPFAKASPCTQRSEPSQISPRRCSFLSPSSLFSGPLTIATSYEFTWSAIKWPTRETDVLVEIARINFFAIVNDLKWWKKLNVFTAQVRDARVRYNYFLLFAFDLSFSSLYIYFSAIMSMGSFQRWRLKEMIGKGTVQNLSQVGRNISDTFNTRLLSSWWHVLIHIDTWCISVHMNPIVWEECKAERSGSFGLYAPSSALVRIVHCGPAQTDGFYLKAQCTVFLPKVGRPSTPLKL